MNFKLAFDAPFPTSNGMGGVIDGWIERHVCWAALTFLRGGEAVMGARLAGRQPVVVTVRDCAAARLIETDWRMRDIRSGVAYNIRTIIPSDDRATLQLTCESGVAL